MVKKKSSKVSKRNSKGKLNRNLIIGVVVVLVLAVVAFSFGGGEEEGGLGSYLDFSLFGFVEDGIGTTDFCKADAVACTPGDFGDFECCSGCCGNDGYCSGTGCVAIEGCIEDTDCSEGEQCSAGICTPVVEGEACIGDFQCEPNEDCVGGVCVPALIPAPECKEDAVACTPGEFGDFECCSGCCGNDGYCSGTGCVAIEGCIEDSECPDGEECAGGVCAPIVENACSFDGGLCNFGGDGDSVCCSGCCGSDGYCSGEGCLIDII